MEALHFWKSFVRKVRLNLANNNRLLPVERRKSSSYQILFPDLIGRYGCFILDQAGVAEELGDGLQTHLRRFNSDPRLQK